jgi:hypothetical protein
MEQSTPSSNPCRIIHARKGPSQTAEGVAALRAAESMLPEDERICCDPYAICFINPARLTEVIVYSEDCFPGLRNTIVARVRYFDDTIRAAVRNGLEQLVIMGAGYGMIRERTGSMNSKDAYGSSRSIILILKRSKKRRFRKFLADSRIT